MIVGIKHSHTVLLKIHTTGWVYSSVFLEVVIEVLIALRLDNRVNLRKMS